MANIEDWRQPEQLMETAIGPDALLSPTEIIGWATKLLSKREEEKVRLESIDKWYRGTQDPYKVPEATRELQGLLELSRTPW